MNISTIANNESLAKPTKLHIIQAPITYKPNVNSENINSITLISKHIDYCIYQVELKTEMTFYKAFKTKTPRFGYSCTAVVKELFTHFGSDATIKWLQIRSDDFQHKINSAHDSKDSSQLDSTLYNINTATNNSDTNNTEARSIIVSNSIITNLSRYPQETTASLFGSKATNASISNSITELDSAYAKRYDNEFSDFVNTYKKTITSEEVRFLLRNKRDQKLKTSEQLFDEIKAVSNFFYRHYSYIISQRDVKRIMLNSLSQEANCEELYNPQLVTKTKDFFRNFKKRVLDVEASLCHLEAASVELLPNNFDLAPFKRVHIMNNAVETYLKKVVQCDKDRFALFMYSNDKVQRINSEGFEHVFIDGTKSSIPFGQQFQLLFVNFVLKSGRSTTGLSILMRGSSEKAYDSVLEYVNTIICIKDKQIHVDFEMALINSATKLSSNINACYFHFARNLQDRVRYLQKKHKMKVSKRLYEYGKILMFVPPSLIDHHRQYMKSMIRKSLVNSLFVAYLDNTYINKRYNKVLYQKHSQYLTNNISESVNGQLSNYYHMKPRKFEWLDFLLYNEKRVINRNKSSTLSNFIKQPDVFDQFVVDLQSKTFNYSTYKYFLRRSERSKSIKKNMHKDRRYFRRT